jgi:hypothetical protein
VEGRRTAGGGENPNEAIPVGAHARAGIASASHVGAASTREKGFGSALFSGESDRAEPAPGARTYRGGARWLSEQSLGGCTETIDWRRKPLDIRLS